MVIKNITKYNSPINCLGRILSSVTVNAKFNDESGEVKVKLAVSNTSDFANISYINIPDGSLSYRYQEDANYTDVKNTDIVTVSENKEYDFKVSHLLLSDGILPEYLRNLTYIYIKIVFLQKDTGELYDKIIGQSQYFILTFAEKGTIEFTDNKVYHNPIKSIHLLLDHRIFGTPSIKVYVSNNILGENQTGKVWEDVTDNILHTKKSIIFNNAKKVLPTQSDFSISVRIEISKTTTDDHYMFFGYILSVVEDKFYKVYNQ